MLTERNKTPSLERGLPALSINCAQSILSGFFQIYLGNLSGEKNQKDSHLICLHSSGCKSRWGEVSAHALSGCCCGDPLVQSCISAVAPHSELPAFFPVDMHMHGELAAPLLLSGVIFYLPGLPQPNAAAGQSQPRQPGLYKPNKNSPQDKAGCPLC